MALTTSLRYLLFFCLFATLVSGNESLNRSAWNGHTTQSSTKKSFFSSYYVPPGAKSYDSSLPLIHYSGRWTELFTSDYIHASIHRTTALGAAASFTFTGTGIEWFGSSDKKHGRANVYINGKLVQVVDARTVQPLNQQRLFSKYDLPFGKHTIRIVNAGKDGRPARINLDAFVVTRGRSMDRIPLRNLVRSESTSSQWTLVQNGSTGVHAMQLAVVSDSHALIVDKVEHNPLTISGRPAWAALYNLKTHAVKPLAMKSNSFCAGGTFLSDGTLVNVGGNPVVEDHTSAADFGDLNGLQSIRIFRPCESETADGCIIREDHARNRMASPRWYNTVIRIPDGSAMIIGGSKRGGWINNVTTNNPTIEYFPPKTIHGSNGMPIQIPFLVDTLNSNLFPMAFVLPDGKVFMAANRDAMIYDWKSNVERRLPSIPNGVRVTYPMTGTAVLLPLTPDDNYTAEILLCGGSTLDDTQPGYTLSSQSSASTQCSRMTLTDNGIAAGWQVEQMPEARTMADAVLLPTGDVFIVNGAESGISGYGNVRDQIGTSNADRPVLRPVLYKPRADAGRRFSTEGMPTSEIPRLYHSVATLTPAGDIMVAGSNPNLDRSELRYGTEYRVEWMQPPYMKVERPEIKGGWDAEGKRTIRFGKKVHIEMRIPPSLIRSDVKVALMDLGYVTHAVHANSRLVYLVASLDAGANVLSIDGPPNGNIYPPGPGWLYVVIGGVPSRGVKVMVGDGEGPVINKGALENVLKNTRSDQ